MRVVDRHSASRLQSLGIFARSPKVTPATSRFRLPHETTSGVPFSSTSSTSNVVGAGPA